MSLLPTYTTNAHLIKPATAQRNWDVLLNANADSLDGMSTIGQLLVTPTEVPSATLNVRVTAGAYGMGNGTVGNYAGNTSFTLTASATTYLWLTDAGVLSTSSAFPTTAHVRLAKVVTSASTVQSVIDERLGPRTCGTGLDFVLKTGDTMSGPLSITSASTSAVVFAADPTVPGVGFFGTSPATQAAAVIALTDGSTGTASNTISDVGTSFSQTTLDNNFAALTAKVNALIAALKRHGLMSS